MRAPRFWYDVHGLCRIESDFPVQNLAFFEGPPHPGQVADITIRRGSLKRFPTSEFSPVGQEFSYGSSRDAFLARYVWLGFPWSVLINGLGGGTKVELVFDEGPLARAWLRPIMMKPEFLVNSLLHIALIRRGLTFVHSAALARKGEALLLAAFSNTGKTTTSLQLVLRKAATVMSDDTTIADASGACYSYPVASSISPESYRLISDRIGFTAAQSMRLSALQVLSKVLPAPITNQRLSVTMLNRVENFGAPARSSVRSICFLQEGEEKTTEVSKRYAKAKLLALGRNEYFWRNHPVITGYSFCNTGFEISSLERRDDEIVESLAERASERFLISGNRRSFASSVEKVLDTF